MCFSTVRLKTTTPANIGSPKLAESNIFIIIFLYICKGSFVRGMNPKFGYILPVRPVNSVSFPQIPSTIQDEGSVIAVFLYPNI
jgi:hypothetical protein